MRQACLLLCVVVCTGMLLAPAPLQAQAIGRISGSVSDATGAVVPGAKVTITNLETGVTWTKTTDENGFYVQTQLPVGPYKVEAEAQGFQKAVKTGFDLVADGRLTADLKLQLASVTATVQVTEVLGETVNTVSGELAHTIDSEQVQDLALNGRNYLQLVSLVPGVALLDEDQMATTTSLSVTTQAVNGGRTDTNHLQVDGGMNMDSGSNGSQINNVGVDFVREVSVKTSGFSAELGRASGASVNVVTKSGGSDYHGGLLETLRNDYVDAAGYFTPRDARGQPQKPSFRFNDYGWNLGGPIAFGPIKKKRLFFFAGQEYKTIRQYIGSAGNTSPQRRTLPTRAERQGFFADRTSTTIRYPASMYPTPTNVPNKDLSALMTPDGKAIMKVYDAMEKYAAAYVDTPTSNNATFLVYNPFNWRQDMARLDFAASDHHQIYFRWIHDNYDLIDPFGTFNSSQLPTTPDKRNRPGYGPQLSHVWTASPRVINEAKINASWNGQRTPLTGDNWKRSTYGFQFPLVFAGNGLYGAAGIPDVTISSFASFNGPSTVYLLSPVTDISLSDNLTYSRRSHTIKTGLQIIRNRKDQNGRTNYDGIAAFNTSGNTNTTNYALADAALGIFQNYQESASDPVGFFRFWQYEAYVQDSWRVRKGLSIEMGLRFSHYLPTYTVANNMSNWELALWNPAQAVKVSQNAQGLIVPGSGNPYDGLIRVGNGVPKDQIGRVPAVASGDINAVPAGAPRGMFNPMNFFMPRFSVAWVPRNNGKSTIRGGFGTFHTRDQGNMFFSQVTLPPFNKLVSYDYGNLSNPSGGAASAAAPMGGITAIDPRLLNGAVYNFNLGVQRELPQGFFLDVSYAGSVGHHLSRKPDINYPSFALISANYALPSAQRLATNAMRPYPGYSSIRMFMSDANSNYNALQTYLTRRKGNAVFTVSYTWSHALTDAPAYDSQFDSGLEYQSRHYNYGPSSNDRRHIFVATYTYRIPFLRDRHGFLGGLGRWELSGIFRKQSGAPLTPVGSASGVTRRADYIGGPVDLPADQRTPNHYFNTAAFQTAANTRLGNAGVGIIEGPGLVTTDVSLRKEFVVRRAARSDSNWRLKVQADAFNIPNHPNFRSLDVTTSNSTFGSFSACGPARNFQLGLKFNF
jgi:hypothetical protein